mgnify:CR=1 FL=1
MKESDYINLLKEAKKARKNAYCPHSGFAVGAALLCARGNIVTGCNVENAAFFSICAEQNALAKAISEGEKDFVAMAVSGAPVGQEGKYCPPCGTCRQMMTELCEPEKFEIILNTEEGYAVFKLSTLFPEAFELGASK